MRNSSKVGSAALWRLFRRLLITVCNAFVAMSIWGAMTMSATPCDWTPFTHLGRAEMRAHLAHFEPLHPPCCSKGLNLTGTVELQVGFDTEGKVVCAEAVQGQPLAIQSAMQSVKQWKFRPYELGGEAHAAFGQIVVRYRLADQGSTSRVE